MRKYKIAAITKSYGGFNFRSKLEYNFAKLIDTTNVFSTWAYEPYRINGYLPDFEAFCPAIRSKVLIEIKPGIEFVDLTKYAKSIGENIFVVVFVYKDSLRAVSLNCPEIQDWLNNWFEFSPTFRANWDSTSYPLLRHAN